MPYQENVSQQEMSQHDSLTGFDLTVFFINTFIASI